MRQFKLKFHSFIFLKILLSLATILACVYVFNACRKDTLKTTFDETKATAKFFSYPASLDTNIKEFAYEIQKQNGQYHFLQFFIDNNGYPAWENYQLVTSGVGTVAVIPFSFDAQQETNGFIICRKNSNNIFSFELYKKAFLVSYGFTQRENDSLNAQQVQGVLNKLNYDHFNITTYRLADYRMLPDSIIKNHPQEIDVTRLNGHIKAGNKKKNSPGNNLVESCISYLDETDWWYNPDGDACNCDGDEYYSYSTYSYNTICTESSGGGNNYGGTTQQTRLVEGWKWRRRKQLFAATSCKRQHLL